jgi:uncharacterized protein (TIGR02466 family)|tara:strand:+ start:276 stop:875 length:600 start_codon:yes stop_codon:yes gene_type:complete
MDKPNKTINYHFFHWGPFLYKTSLTQEELNSIKKLCTKKSKDYRRSLAGLIKHEHQIDVKKLFPIIGHYFNSYAKAEFDYSGTAMGNKIELVSAWVNYMTKFESNPMHTHDDDLSFVIYTKIPKNLKQEYNDTVSNTRPGCINFINSLGKTKYALNQHTFFPEVGDMFIFPADLNHFVNHFQSEGERVSISGNLTVTNG